jgi:hypothetical protein
VADAGRGPQVSSERRLTVGSRAHEVEPPPRAEDVGAEAATRSRHSYSKGIGGIEMKTSSVRRATSA